MGRTGASLSGCVSPLRRQRAALRARGQVREAWAEGPTVWEAREASCLLPGRRGVTGSRGVWPARPPARSQAPVGSRQELGVLMCVPYSLGIVVFTLPPPQAQSQRGNGASSKSCPGRQAAVLAQLFTSWAPPPTPPAASPRPFLQALFKACNCCLKGRS